MQLVQPLSVKPEPMAPLGAVLPYTLVRALLKLMVTGVTGAVKPSR